MNSVLKFVLNNKLAIWILTIIILFSGIYSTMQMKKETMPNISIPYLMVITAYPGATSEQIMDELGEPLENTLKNLSDVTNVTVTSYSNFAMTTVEFDYGVDMDKKEDDIEKLVEDLNLPEGAAEPTVMALSMDMMPVLQLSVSDEKLSDSELTDYIKKEILPKLQKIDGVSEATVSGAYYEKHIINFNEEYLAYFGLNKEDIKTIIESNNFYIPLGLYEFEDSIESIVVDNKINNIKDLENLIVGYSPEGQPVPLAGVATIEVEGNLESISRTNGNPSMSISVTKTPDANTVEVSEEVLAVMEDFKDDRNTFSYNIVFNQADDINSSISAMLEKAIFGSAVAIFIILIFLRNIRSTLISVVSIPLSIIIAFLILKQLDITLNLMTLGAMTVSIGRVIDDSIVVVENIYRRLAEKDNDLTPKQLISSATLEMFKSIASSTFVTIAVFLPIALVGGMIGELFMPFALTMGLSLLASLLVAVTIVPVMAHTFFKKELLGERDAKEDNHKGLLTRIYDVVLNWVLNHKIISSIITILLFVGSLALLPQVGFSFMGEEESKQITLTYSAETGTVKSDIEKALDEVESYYLDDDRVKTVQASMGSSSAFESMMNSGDATVSLTFKDSVEDMKAIEKEIEEKLEDFNSDKGEWKSSMASTMSFSSNTISYDIYGQTLEDIEPVVQDLEKILSENDNLQDVTNSLAISYDENRFVIDREKIAEYGVSPMMIIGMLYSMETETEFTTVNNIEIVEVTKPKEFKSVEEILDTMIPTPYGQFITIGDVVNVEEGNSPLSLTKNEGKFYVTVSASILTDDIASVSSQIAKEIDKIELPVGVSIETAGVTAQMIEAFTQLGLAMLAAILIVYFILVVTFKEGLAPFAILFSLPLSIIGVVLGLFISGITVDISAMLGLLMLIGIVVTNAIILIDRIINNEKSGMERHEAILEAGETRIRPILMTAIATIGAMVPMAIGMESSIISQSMAITVIGGLTSSTVLTLVVVPMVFDFLSNLFRKDRTIEDL